MDKNIRNGDECLAEDSTLVITAPSDSLEQAFSSTEKISESLLRMASETTQLLKKMRGAANVGDLTKLKKTINEVNESTIKMRLEVGKTTKNWEFDESAYLSSASFQRDLLEMGKQMGVEIFEHEGAFYSHEVVLRVLPEKRRIAIDRSRDDKIRPSVIVKRLKELQCNPNRFKPQAFLDVLYTAYSMVVSMRGQHNQGTGVVVPLVEMYELLTLLPWQSTEYTRQEFARDVYFLDKSGKTKAKKNQRINFHASTGTRDSNKTLSVMGRGGRIRTYYGTSFVKTG